MRIGRHDFTEVVLADFEFVVAPGERPHPVCLVAHELVSGRTHRLFREALLSMEGPPFPLGPKTLFVAFYASAEIGCFDVLDWLTPHNIIDLYPDFRITTNGYYLPRGSGLLGALIYYSIESITATEKQQMRDLIMRGGPWNLDERRAILDYCESDVVGLRKLWEKMLPTLDVERALLRGRYMASAAHVEHHGVPIDVESLTTIQTHRTAIQHYLIKDVDANYGVFDGPVFSSARWERYVAQHELAWPRLDSGRLALDEDTFKAMASIYPAVEPMQTLRKSLSALKNNKLAVGRDGRNRYLLSAFASITGRNQPSNSQSIFGQPKWLRGAIQPPPGYAVANVDFGQQENGIGAGLSQDQAMMTAYLSGDPYKAGAIQAGLMSAEDDEKTQQRIRKMFKTGVALILDIVSQAARTGLRSGRSVRAIAGPHRSLRARARSCTMC